MAGSNKRGRQTNRQQQLASQKKTKVDKDRCMTCLKRFDGIFIHKTCTACLGQQNENEPVEIQPAPVPVPVPAPLQEPVEPAPLQEAIEVAENSTVQAETVEHVGPTTRARARARRGIRVQPNELEQAPAAGWSWNSCNIL